MRVEHATDNQGLNPGGEVVGGRDDAPGRPRNGIVQARVVVWSEGAGPGRSPDLGQYGGEPTKATEALPYR